MREWWIEIFYTKGGLTFGSPGYTREGEMALTFSQPPKVKHKNSVELINVIEKAAYDELLAKTHALEHGLKSEKAHHEWAKQNEASNFLRIKELETRAQKLVGALEKIALEPPGCDSAWFAKEALAEWKKGE